MLSLNGNVVKNYSMFSWTEAQDFKYKVRHLMKPGDTVDMVAKVRSLSPLVLSKFKRKAFADFDYLSVSASPLAVNSALIMAIIAFITFLVLIILTELRPNTSPNTSSRDYWQERFR